MFERARRRLTIAYVLLFGALLGIFSIAFFAIVVTIIQPNFDLSPDTENDQVVQVATDEAIERIGIALVVADLIAVVVVGLGAWFLAARTLRPIRAAHERQRRFVADASHEMRTPLTVIRTTAEAALGPAAGADKQTAALGTIVVAATELSDMTGNLLALAEADESRLSGSPQARCDLSVVVAERLALRASAPGPRPTVELAENLEVLAVSDDLARVVDNLVENAYRHGGHGVAKKVRTSQSSGRALLEVSDDGPGISEEDLTHIFEPFYRGRSDATAASGTGLGLAIVADLARRNGARLTVDSTPGHGATFRLSLALAH